MRTLEKCVVGLFLVVVLGGQVWAIFPPEARSVSWYWPFTNYPMYSQARLPGEAFREHVVQLRLPDSESGLRLAQEGIGELEPEDERILWVDYDDLRIHGFTYYRILDVIGGWASGRSGWDDETVRENKRLLEQSISMHLELDEYEVVLLKREFPIGSRGLEDPDPPWTEVHRWVAPAGTGEPVRGASR